MGILEFLESGISWNPVKNCIRKNIDIHVSEYLKKRDNAVDRYEQLPKSIRKQSVLSMKIFLFGS